MTFDKYKRRLELSTNKAGTLGEIFIKLFPKSEPIGREMKNKFFGRMATIVRDSIGDGDLVLEQMWKAVAAQPRGDPVDYVHRAVKGVVERIKNRNGTGRNDGTDQLLSDIAENQRRQREAGKR